MKKIIYVLILNLILVLNVSAKNHNLAQVTELDKLFNELSKINNIFDGDILEKKIWAVWNKHPNQKFLTEKLELGTKLMYQRQYDYALEVFTNIIEIDPEWPEAWNKRATLLFLMKDYQKSLDDINKVLDLEPRHFGALSGRAQIYIDLELYQKALEDLKDAKKIHPVIRGNGLIDELEKLINGENV
tara:strand:+ start:162 stop:722 length:561 start_codon:yes stop_codon:yes gene_type:complete